MSTVSFNVNYLKTAKGMFTGESKERPLIKLAKEITFPNWDALRGNHSADGRGSSFEGDEDSNLSHISANFDASDHRNRKTSLSSFLYQMRNSGPESGAKRLRECDFNDTKVSSGNPDLGVKKVYRDRVSVSSNASTTSVQSSASSSDTSPKQHRHALQELKSILNHSANVSGKPPNGRSLKKALSVKTWKEESDELKKEYEKSAEARRRSISYSGITPVRIEVTRFEGSPSTTLFSTVGKAVMDTEDDPYTKKLRQYGKKYAIGGHLSSSCDEVSSLGTGSSSSVLTKRSKYSKKKSRAGSIEKHKDPSHYKGVRRGSYCPDYDPMVSAHKARYQTRSSSMFDASHSSKVGNELQMRVLQRAFERQFSSQSESSMDEKDSHARFHKFVNANRSRLESSASIMSEKSNAVNYLPTVRNGRTVSITKSKSMENIASPPKEATIRESTDVQPEKQLEAQSGVTLSSVVPRIDLQLRHPQTDISATSSDSDNSTKSSKSASKDIRSHRSAALLAPTLSHVKPDIRRGSSGLLTPPTERRATSRQTRVNSAFDGVSPEYLTHLQRKYDHAKRRAERVNSASSSAISSEIQASNHTTPLHESVKVGDVKLSQKLIVEGGDVNALDGIGMPPFHYAIVGGHYECVALLLTSGANISEYFKGRRVKYFR